MIIANAVFYLAGTIFVFKVLWNFLLPLFLFFSKKFETMSGPNTVALMPVIEIASFIVLLASSLFIDVGHVLLQTKPLAAIGIAAIVLSYLHLAVVAKLVGAGKGAS